MCGRGGGGAGVRAYVLVCVLNDYLLEGEVNVHDSSSGLP